MKIITNGETIAVTGPPVIGADAVRYPLASAPASIGETVRLEADTGMHLRTDTAAHWLRAFLDGNTLVLTNTPAREPEKPTLEELRGEKLAELNAACDAAIAAGCGVTLSDGTEGHISLTIPDQINLTNAQGAVQAGAAGYAYHLDGSLCEVFPAEDIAIMAQAATAHVLYHQTYCNHARAWARQAETAAEIEAVFYGAELPVELAEHMAAVLSAAGSGEEINA